LSPAKSFINDSRDSRPAAHFQQAPLSKDWLDRRLDIRLDAGH
jgi:hypothetical protein